jgi:hypothetical protein
MLNHAVALENLIEHLQRAAGIDHEILGDDLEPVDNRLCARRCAGSAECAGRCRRRDLKRIETIAGHGTILRDEFVIQGRTATDE